MVGRVRSVASAPLLTGRQDRILRFLRSFASLEGYPPSIREITEGIGIRSPDGVYWYLRGLEKRGFISHDFSRSRVVRQCLE